MKITRLLFFLVPLNAYIYGQDLTGTWIGDGGSGAPYLKLVIIQMGDSCYGYTYDEGPGFCKANFEGKFDAAKQSLSGKGTSFIDKSFGHSLGVYNLNYLKHGSSEYLEGKIGPKSSGALILSLGITSYARLRKITMGIDTTRFMSGKIIAFENKNRIADTPQSTANMEAAPATGKKETATGIYKTGSTDTLITGKEERRSRMVKTIYTDVDTVKMVLYDNGVVDDDTVTVFFDNAVVLDRYRITEKGRELYLPLTGKNKSHTVELFANNLGTIPPNTALIVIIAGSSRYELYASYDFSTNAKIIFQYKE